MLSISVSWLNEVFGRGRREHRDGHRLAVIGSAGDREGLVQGRRVEVPIDEGRQPAAEAQQVGHRHGRVRHDLPLEAQVRLVNERVLEVGREELDGTGTCRRRREHVREDGGRRGGRRNADLELAAGGARVDQGVVDRRVDDAAEVDAVAAAQRSLRVAREVEREAGAGAEIRLVAGQLRRRPVEGEVQVGDSASPSGNGFCVSGMLSYSYRSPEVDHQSRPHAPVVLREQVVVVGGQLGAQRAEALQEVAGVALAAVPRRVVDAVHRRRQPDLPVGVVDDEVVDVAVGEGAALISQVAQVVADMVDVEPELERRCHRCSSSRCPCTDSGARPGTSRVPGSPACRS